MEVPSPLKYCGVWATVLLLPKTIISIKGVADLNKRENNFFISWLALLLVNKTGQLCLSERIGIYPLPENVHLISDRRIWRRQMDKKQMKTAMVK